MVFYAHILKIIFIYLFLAVLVLRCCVSSSLVGAIRGYSSRQQLLLLRSTGCRAHGLQELQCVGSIVVAHGLSHSTQHVGSSWTRDQTCVFWTSRRILYHWATLEAPEDISGFQTFNAFTHFGPFRNKPFKECTQPGTRWPSSTSLYKEVYKIQFSMQVANLAAWRWVTRCGFSEGVCFAPRERAQDKS